MTLLYMGFVRTPFSLLHITADQKVALCGSKVARLLLRYTDQTPVLWADHWANNAGVGCSMCRHCEAALARVP